MTKLSVERYYKFIILGVVLGVVASVISVNTNTILVDTKPIISDASAGVAAAELFATTTAPIIETSTTTVPIIETATSTATTTAPIIETATSTATTTAPIIETITTESTTSEPTLNLETFTLPEDPALPLLNSKDCHFVYEENGYQNPGECMRSRRGY
ncbi:MAG: hypothetical protein RLZZ230_118 [Candidatus Parcubacteria bacterium]